eukprot:PLAT10798.2.p1 GENE.PLAT10798.2~~PLAT10798.2.p1  ORF type:complete len:229 (+),score=101.86 PLAT10798.2:360-1046(+)
MSEPAASTRRDDDGDKKVAEEAAAAEVVTPDPVDMSRKHPLQSRWVLWFDAPSGKRMDAKAWAEQLKQVYSFGTVEEFWGLFNNIMAPSHLSNGCNYHLFREGVRPEWEDPINAAGGKWTATLPKERGAEPRTDVDRFWLNAAMAVVGETLCDDEGEEVTGVVVSIRTRVFRIAVWTRSGEDEARQLELGRRMREIITFPPEVKLEYLLHADSISKGHSYSAKKTLRI